MMLGATDFFLSFFCSLELIQVFIVVLSLSHQLPQLQWLHMSAWAPSKLF